MLRPPWMQTCVSCLQPTSSYRCLPFCSQIIPQDILRKYIMYARDKIRPKLFELDQEKLARLFVDLRRESIATGSFPITVRHLESMIRMAEASAKMSLREYVRADDIDMAISVAVQSFVSAQKMSIKKTLERVCSLGRCFNSCS